MKGKRSSLLNNIRLKNCSFWQLCVFTSFFFAPFNSIYINALIFLKVSLVSHPTVHYLLTVLCASTCVVVSFFFRDVHRRTKKNKASQKKRKYCYVQVSLTLFCPCIHTSSVFLDHWYLLLLLLLLLRIFLCIFFFYHPLLKKPKFRKIFFFMQLFFCVVSCKSESSPGSLCRFFYIIFSYFLIFFLLLFFYEHKKK